MIPLWLFTLGRTFVSDDVDITIPFTNIMMILVCFLIPVIIGLLIQRYCKRVSTVIVRFLRPLFIISLLLLYTTGAWSNRFAVRLFRPLLVLAGFLLPCVGLTLSGVAAFVLGQPRQRIITIAIETGIQNIALAVVLMKLSLPQPDADLSIVGPVIIGMSMHLLLWLACAISDIRRRLKLC